jgi:hypothetical protein
VEQAGSASEAEGQELGAPGGVSMHQGTKADLVSNVKLGGPAIEALSALELLHMDLLAGAVLEPLFGGGGVAHEASCVVKPVMESTGCCLLTQQCAGQPGADQPMPIC